MKQAWDFSNEFVKPIPVAFNLPAVGTHCQISGWGVNEKVNPK